MHFLTRNKLKTVLLLIFLYGVVFSTHIFATQTTSSNRENEETVQTLGESCGDMSFFVAGSFFVKPNQKVTYTITSNSILDQQANVEYELRQENKLLET